MIDANMLNGPPEQVRELIALYVQSFFVWKTKTTYRQQQPIETAFPVWWIMRGPVNFRAHEDMLTFRALVRDGIDHEAQRRSDAILSAESVPAPDEGAE